MNTKKDIEILVAKLRSEDASARLRCICVELEHARLWNTPESNELVDRLFAESKDADDTYKALLAGKE